LPSLAGKVLVTDERWIASRGLESARRAGGPSEEFCAVD